MPTDGQNVATAIELTWRHFYVTSTIDKKYLLNSKVSGHLPNTMELAVMQLTTIVAGENVKEIKYPLNWVQAFRERWFPKFILKRWPVRYHSWKIDFLYPEIEMRGQLHPEIAIYDSQRSRGYRHWEDKPEELGEEN
jgi:hypothetical protein